MTTSRGLSLHIVVNRVDPEHYGGSWDGKLEDCENDCADMHRIARRQGFEASSLRSAWATRALVTAAVRNAATQLRSGDFFLLTYSGHGGTIPDVDGDEEDRVDETWCLFDGQLLDDELNLLWAEFDPVVRLYYAPRHRPGSPHGRAGSGTGRGLRAVTRNAAPDCPLDGAQEP